MDLAMAPVLGQDPLETALRAELRRGERLLWSGRQLARVAPASFGIFLFAIPWTAFALFWTAMAAAGVSSMDGDGPTGWLAWAFPLFGLPFILIGLGMMAMPFAPLLGARRTIFAVTDQRVLLLYRGAGLRTKSAEGRLIGEIERTERPDGSGSLKINLLRAGEGTDRFVIGEVAGVRLAEEQVRRLAEQAAAASS